MNVEGFMPEPGLNVLRELARGKTVLEVGTYKGKTALGMAETAELVVTLDHWTGDHYAGKAHTLPDFWRFLTNHPHGSKVLPISGKWESIIHLLDLTKFDLVFYDADHDYAPTFNFLWIAFQRVRKDAVLVVDDHHGAYPQVMAAVRDVIALTGWECEQVEAMAVLTHG